MRIYAIENANPGFALFLIAMNLPFFYANGAFVITAPEEVEDFKSFCKEHHVRETELDQMTILAI